MLRRLSCVHAVVLILLPLLAITTKRSRADDAVAWPALPHANAAVEIPAQEWPLRPGPRRVRVLVHYPGGLRANVNAQTGVMLTLHNWGGTDCVGTADPQQLAGKLNVVALCVNYLQSGKEDSIDGPEPYDFGYLQALDALRALWWMTDQLQQSGQPYNTQRLFATGGSGGGNVTLMANKLAPRTFACVIDLCGMKKLSDDIAFHLPGGSDLDARYRREPTHPNHLTLDHQELRFVGNPDHLAIMKQLGATAHIVTVHGADDTTCPYADAVEMVDWMRRRQIDVEPLFVTRNDLDGQTFSSSGHALGNRTRIVLERAGRDLAPDHPQTRTRSGKSDFERREKIVYPTSNGAFVIDYSNGYPIGRFEPTTALPDYPDHHRLLVTRDASGAERDVQSVDDWRVRAAHIRRHFQRVTGPLPSPMRRVPLDVKVLEETQVGKLVRRKVTFQSDRDDRVPAFLFLPAAAPGNTARLPAVLCLQQTTAVGKDEPAGVRGDPTMKYAIELAERGFVTLAPDYPSFGEHAYDFVPGHGYVSGTMKAVWDNMRAIDLLESLEFVDSQRIGCIGHSLGGHNGLFTAVFDERIRVLVSSCGFTSLRKDDVPSWTGPRYMPRIASEFQNDVNRLPFDFPELVASLAPRSVRIVAATRDDDFDVSGVRDLVEAVKPVYNLFGHAQRLTVDYPDAPHSFPETARHAAYEFLAQELSAP